MNKLTIIGNLTREPECRTVNTANGSTSVVNYTVAVNRPKRNGQDQGADFFRVTRWGASGENDMKWLHKGSKVWVCGPVSVNVYTNKDGQAAASMEIDGREVEYLSGRGDDQAATAPAPSVPAVVDQQTGMVVADDPDLPF